MCCQCGRGVMPVSRCAGKGWGAWLGAYVSAWWGWMKKGVEEEDCGARVWCMWWVGCENSMRPDGQVVQRAFNSQRMCLIAWPAAPVTLSHKQGWLCLVNASAPLALSRSCSHPPCLPLTPPSPSQAAAADKGNAELASAAKAEVDKLLGLKKQLAAAEEA